MNIYLKVLMSVLFAFALSMAFAPLVIMWMKKLKAGQVVLGYVDQHAYKTGTPTMGGMIFVLPAALITFLLGKSSFATVSAAVMLSYAVLGFLDDFIKIRHKQNLGLRAYQKIIGQLGIAALVAVYCFRNAYIGSTIELPFTDAVWNLKWWYLPFVMFIYIAVTNSVNLTDGLDGLATSTGLVYFAAFLIIVLSLMRSAEGFGQTAELKELTGLAVFCASVAGGLLAFLWHNSFPAKIMMGDTGSLALGGAAATVAVFSKNPFLIPLVGIMFVLSSISVIVQVISFKLTKKRVFLMSPFHHHLEKKGYAETKITAWYAIITAVLAIITFIAEGVL